MADPVAITAIVVSGVLGPSVGAWWGLRRVRHEHENERVLADRADLRLLLGETARDLTRAGRMRGAVQGQFMTHGPSTLVNAKATLDKFFEAARDTDLHGATLALTVGRAHPVTEAYVRAFRALLAAESAVTLAHGPGAIEVKEAWDQLNESARAFTAAEAEFLDEAHKLVASQLEPRRRLRQGVARTTA